MFQLRYVQTDVKTENMFWSYIYKRSNMKTTKDSKLTIRLSKDEKQKVQEEASRLNLDASKFIREHFIKLISEK
jgi:hypothetical protein